MLCLLALLAATISAQPFSIGVAGGVPGVGALNSASPYFRSITRPYVVGPVVELRLPRGFAIESGALYRRLGYDFSYDLRSVSGTSIRGAGSASASMWEFPVLAKYRRPLEKMTPFVVLGPSFNRVTAMRVRGERCSKGPFEVNYRCGSVAADDGWPELRHRGAMGITVGGGIESRCFPLRIAPGVRYTHWGERNFGTRGADIATRLDQVTFLLEVQLW
jgi:hypothetical protein